MIAQEQQLAEVAQIRGDVVKAEWGNQIRNYVFHPYKMVRNTRSVARNLGSYRMRLVSTRLHLLSAVADTSA